MRNIGFVACLYLRPVNMILCAFYMSTFVDYGIDKLLTVCVFVLRDVDETITEVFTWSCVV